MTPDLQRMISRYVEGEWADAPRSNADGEVLLGEAVFLMGIIKLGARIEVTITGRSS